MTDALVFRGPDAQEVWIGQQVGFGHALFRTTEEGGERQPCTLDGEVWITGDVRVDGRAELMQALQAEGRNPGTAPTDPELVLHAYHAWGEALVGRLLGDFAFAIWDGPNRRLFCARDQLGVKPFFYAELGKQLVISNTLSCLQAHGSMPDELNDAAIGDFLLFGHNCDPKTTTYKAIQRLPGGHILSWSPCQELRVRRYWTLPVYEELRLRSHGDYVELFRSLLRTATADRLRTDRVGVHMSGGLDSSLIAGTAYGLLAARGKPFEVRAHTIVYDSLISDNERHYSGLVARALDIPIQYFVADNYGLLDRDGAHYVPFPQPLTVYSQPLLLNAFNQQVATGSRVALTGLDGDALLTSSWPAHLASLARDLKFGRLAADILLFARAKQDLFGALSRRLRWPRHGETASSTYPTWLNPAFEQRLHLKERWAKLSARPSIGTNARSREGAYFRMAHPNWLPTLEGLDAGMTGIPVDRRHPLLDLRVVEFLLSLPAIPWCVDKHILRASAQDLLPQPVIRRRKAPLGGDPLRPLIRDHMERASHPFAFHPALHRYVDATQTADVIDQLESSLYWVGLRVLILNHWLWAKKGC